MTHKQKTNRSRRTFIKGMAYGSALSIAGLSSLAFANKTSDGASAASENREIVSLVNHTASRVTLTVNKNEVITIDAGAETSLQIASTNIDNHAHLNKKNLYIKDVLLGHVSITSDYTKYNGIFPTSIFGTQT